jgi:predicted nucleic acid-binding protein
MIILDTNVISAVMRQDANPVVVGWLDPSLGSLSGSPR